MATQADDSGFGLYFGGMESAGKGGGWGGWSADGTKPSRANSEIFLNVEQYADWQDYNPYVVGSAAWATAHGYPPQLPFSERVPTDHRTGLPLGTSPAVRGQTSGVGSQANQLGIVPPTSATQAPAAGSSGLVIVALVAVIAVIVWSAS